MSKRERFFQNPYESPTLPGDCRRNRLNLSLCGFMLGIVSLSGIPMYAIGSNSDLEFLAPVGRSLTLLCVPGAVLSYLGSRRSHKLIALLGCGISVFVMLNLPTIFATFLISAFEKTEGDGGVTYETTYVNVALLCVTYCRSNP